MSGTLNKVILIGRLGKDPELKNVGEKQVCKFSLATEETWGSGEDKKSKTSWHNIVMWGKLADIANQYLAKGSLVYLEGKIDYRKWEDAEGNEKKATDIVASAMTMLGSKQDSKQEPKKKKKEDDEDEDVPF